MKFFTPELFVRFNSPDDEEADRADEEWEEAILAYRQHLDRLRDRMPSPVKKLAGLCLHDAEILAFEQPADLFGPMPYWEGMSILSVRQGDEVVSLIYALWGPVREHPAAGNWPFSEQRKHWLYDELDVSPDDPRWFLHRILLSDGSTLEIPFFSVLIHRIPVGKSPESDASRQIA